MKMRPTIQPNSAGGVPLIVPHVSNKGVVPDDLRTQFALIESVSCTKSPVSLRKENSKSQYGAERGELSIRTKTPLSCAAQLV